ncbi:MAG: hypothetical protein IBX50_09310 [Marinospirillum sp.]|uniref:hypothetical protein n=1 Tax=Marinospirillum sp. TaxID=2183934 RepID=UPI0019DF592E|nr:hypothetical protein [Marinospirillum sp.]MBE0506899.1 hypothetical protein [Marinospirillum sp.]
MQSPKPRIIHSAEEVPSALESLGLDAEIIKFIGESARAARNETLPIDPINAGGTLAYIFGVRAIRNKLLSRGWEKSRQGNIEATVHHEHGIQLWFQNVDKACQTSRIPRAISDKGPGARHLIESGQLDLFNEDNKKRPQKLGSTPTVWVVCVSSDEESLQVEVSRPVSFSGKQYDDFDQRIFVLDKRFEPEAITNEHDIDNIEVNITRKQE